MFLLNPSDFFSKLVDVGAVTINKLIQVVAPKTGLDASKGHLRFDQYEISISLVETEEVNFADFIRNLDFERALANLATKPCPSDIYFMQVFADYIFKPLTS